MPLLVDYYRREQLLMGDDFTVYNNENYASNEISVMDTKQQHIPWWRENNNLSGLMPPQLV